MRSKFERLLSLLLVFVMVIGMVPVGYAQATEGNATEAIVLTSSGANGTGVALADCEYTLGGSYNGAYSLTRMVGETKLYVKPRSNDNAEIPQQATAFEALRFEWKAGGTVQIWGGGGSMHFHYADAVPRWNRCTGICEEAAHNLYLFQATGKGTGTDLPGYSQVTTADGLIAGARYLIVGKNNQGNWFVMRPVDSTQKYDHIAQIQFQNLKDSVTALKQDEQHTVTVKGNYETATGDDYVTISTSPCVIGNIAVAGDVITDLTKIDSSTKYLIRNNRSNTFVGTAKNGDGLAMDNIVGADKMWTVEAVTDGYTINNGGYMTIGGGSAAISNDAVVLSIATAGDTGVWSIGMNGQYLNDYGGGGTKAAGHDSVDAGSKWNICPVVHQDIAGTTITFTAKSAGDTEITIGDVTYNFHVHGYESTVTTPASCESQGLKTYTCECGDKYTETVNALGHSYISDYDPDCNVCGAERTVKTFGSEKLTYASAYGYNGDVGVNITDKIADGVIENNDSFWAVENTNVENCYILVDLGGEKLINKVEYTKRYHTGGDGSVWNCTGSLLDYTVWVSSDGDKWTQVATGETVDGTTPISFPAVNAAYVKLTSTRSYHWQYGQSGQPDNRNTAMACTEFAVFKAVCNEHQYGDFTVTKEADCVNAGQQERTCSVCGHVGIESIGALGHTFERDGGDTNAIKCGDCSVPNPNYKPVEVAPDVSFGAGEGESVAEDVKNEIVQAVQNNKAVNDYKPVEDREDVEELEITLTSATVKEEENKHVPTVLVFNVTPKMDGEKVASPSNPITFRLPVPGSVAQDFAKVFHNGDQMPGLFEIKVENGDKYVEITSGNFSEYTVEFTDETPAPTVAMIGTQGYATLQAAVEAANAGDTITVIADVADVTVNVDKNLIITGSVTLNNVGINANGADELTVSGLTFTGNSWINSGTAEKLTVSGVTANVTPNNRDYTNSRSAFISLGRSEGQKLELTVENCNIVAKGGTNPILGWAAITKATITGSTFGSAGDYQTNSDSIKFMAIADGAVFTITGNTIYSNYNGIVFAQNTTRDNAYSAVIDSNTFMGGADHIWIEITGGDTVHAAVNVKSNNTVNGNVITAGDIKAHTSVIKNWSAYAGVDVVTDENGKVIGGTLAFYAADAVANGYEVDTNGNVQKLPTVAMIGDACYDSVAEALNAVENGQTITLLEGISGEESGEIEFTRDIEFTITGVAPNYALPVVTFQNATVNIKDAEILIPELDARQNATINVIDSTVHDAGGDSIAKSYYNGAINISGNSVVHMMQVTTMGYITVSDNAVLNATWQTNVYGNGMITIKDSAAVNTAAMHLTGKDYSGRDNTDADRVGKPATIVVDGASLVVGKVISNNGSDYSYNSKEGINIGTVDGKTAVLDIKNGANVNIYMANGETAKIGAGGTVNVDASTFTVSCRAADGKATLSNSGIVNAKGENVTLNINTLTGEDINLLDGAIVKDSTVGGNVFVAGNVTFRGDNTFNMLYDFGTLTDNYGTTAPMAWTVEKGASVTLTNKARYGLGYGDKIVIYGDLADALTARETLTDDDVVLFMHGMVAQESKGWNCDSSLIVKDAYVVIGSNNSFGNKPGNYGGTYTIVFENAVLDASRITFYEALSKTEFTFKNTDAKVGVFMTRDPDSVFTLINTKLLATTTNNGNDEGNYHAGKLVLTNSSLTYSAPLKLEDGTIELDSSSILTAPSISGTGIITIDATDLTDGALPVVGDATGFAGTVVVTGNDALEAELTEQGIKLVGKPIAVIGENNEIISYHSKLGDAIDAVAEGGTIKLLNDVVINESTRTKNDRWFDGLYYVGDKSFTIDLDGFTVTHDGSVNDYLLNFKNDGTKANVITLKNGTVDAGTTAFCALCTSSASTQQITINLESINLINNISDGSVVKIRGGAVLNVNAGTVITGKNSYLGIECIASTVNIYDGAEIYMNGTSSYNGCLVGVGSNGTVNVYGGYGKGVKGGFIAMTSGGTINVKGGEWIANTDGTVGNNSNLYVLTAQNNSNETGYAGASIINVTGGTFRGGMDAWILNTGRNEVAELNISGGNFNADPTTYVVNGYKAVANTDGTFNVKVCVAMVGDVGYTALVDAFKAATEGCTIEILRDVTIDYKWDCRDYAANGSHSQFKESVTINGNGHTIEFAGTVNDGNWNTIFRFEEDATVKNLTVDISEATGAQRVISAKKSLSVDGLTIIGSAKRYGIIFGEGASDAELAAAEIEVKNSTLTGTRRAISDNEGGKDVKSVTVTGNTLNANVYVSASEKVVFSGNTANGEVDIRSYSADNVLSVEAKGNTLTEGVKNYIFAKEIDAQDEFATENPPVKVSTKDELAAALAAAKEGDTIVLTADIDYGTTQLAITKAITLDLGGKTLTTRNAWGGMSVKGNPTIKNGTIVHASNTAAIKVWNATAFEDLVIDVQGKGDANNTIGGIVLQSGSTTRVGTIKNVTIKGAALTNGIETYNCGDATEDVIGSMENVTIDAKGTGLLISAPCGTATNCNISGDKNAIELWIKGNYSASLTLEDSEVEGGVYVHDEFSSNPSVVNSGTLSLVVDEATTGASAEDVTLTLNRVEEVQVEGEVLKTVIKNAQAMRNSTYYATFAEAFADAQAGDTITLLADAEASEAILIDKSLTINGNGHKVTSNATRVFRVTTGDVEVTLNDVNMVSKAVRVGSNDIRGISIDNVNNVKLTLNNCSVDFIDDSACDWAYAVNVTGGANHTLTISGGTYEGANVINVRGENSTVTVENTTLTSLYPNNDEYYGSCIYVVQDKGTSVEATGNTFNGANAVAFNVGSGNPVTESNNTDNTAMVVAKIGDVYYTSVAAAFAAANDGEEVKILHSGTYKVPSSKNITITGMVDGVVFDNIGKHNMGGANVTFYNVTFDYYPNVNYTGLQHSGNLVYNNCTFNGQVFLYGQSETFNNCTFNQNSADAYNVWTYGAKEVDFNNCTFNSAGKSVLVYAESAGITNAISVTNSTFNASAPVDGKAAIEIDTSLTAGANITIDAATTATGFSNGSVSGSSLWNNKKGNNTDANNDVTIEVAGVTVLAPVTFVAKIGNIGYTTLQAAINAAENGETITLLANCNEDVTVVQASDKVITIDGNDKTMTGSITVDGKSAAHATAGLTIKNVKFVQDTASQVFINLGAKGNNDTRYACNVTVENCTFTGTDKTACGIKSYTGGSKNLTVTGCTATGMHSMLQSAGIAGVKISDVTIDNSKNGLSFTYASVGVEIVNANISTDGYGIRADGTGAYDLTVKNSTVDAELPVVIRKNTASGYELTLENNTLSGNTYGYQVIFTAGDDEEAPVAPEVGVKLNVSGAENVFPAYTAKIGDLSYATLADAVAAANAGDEIVMLAPAVVAAGETLELNKDVTITYTSNVPGEDMITNRGNLVIDGATLVYTNTDTTASNVTVSTISCEPGSNLEVKSGIVKNDSANNGSLGIYVFAIDLLTNGGLGDVTATISGGEIISTNYMAIRQFNNGDACKNTLNVTGGKIYGEKRAIQIHMDNDAAYTTISGGEIKAGEGGYALCFFPTNATNIAVTGGTFTGTVYSVSNGFISGGTFDERFDDAYCAEGYVTVKNSDGTFGVKVGEYTVQNTDTGFGYETLADALAAVQNGDNTIILLADNSENVTIEQVEGVNIVIDGQNHLYTGTITIDGNSRFNGAETLTIQNVEFVTSKAGHNFINADSAASAVRYAHNVTVKDSTFTATGAGRNSAVAMQIRQGFDISIENVTASNMHSLIQGKGCDGLTVDDVTVSGKNGIAVGTSKNVKIKNADIIAAGYGIRADGSGAYDMTVENATIKAELPIVVRKNTADGYQLTMEGTNNLSGNANGYQVIFTAVDDEEAPVAPTVNTVLDGIDNLNVFPAYQAKIGNVYYPTLAAAIAAAEATDVVTVLSDIELAEPVTVASGKTVTIDLNGKTISGTDNTEKNFGLFQNNGTLTINDSVGTGKIVVNATINSGWSRYSAVISNNPGGTLVVNGGTIEHLGGTDMAYGIDSLTNGGIGDVSVTINGGHIKSTYRGIRQFLNSDSKQNELIVNGGTIEGANKSIFFHDPSAKANNGKLIVAEAAELKGDVYLFVTEGSTEWPVEVAIAKAAVTGEVTYKNVPAGYEVVEKNGIIGVENGVAKIGDTFYETLADAIAAAQNGETITLLTAVAMDNLTIEKAITLDTNGNTFTGAIVLANADATVIGPETMAVSTNVGEDYKVVYEDGTYKVAAKVYVAAVNGNGYETLSEAIANASAGDTVTLLADITEDVTVNKSVTIDGAGKTFTGKMNLTSNKGTVVIRNVNFDGKGYNGYAVETRGVYYLTIEDCTAKNYGYGFVQLVSSTVLTTVKNVSVSNMNYGVKVDYSSAVVLENVDMTAGVAAVLNSNYGEKTITIKDSKLNILGTWKRSDTIKTTYVFEGANFVDQFAIESALDNFVLGAADATLTAPAGLTVTTNVGEDYKVVYEDGTYKVAAKVYVAEVNGAKYEKLSEAIAAASAGATVTLLADITENVTVSKNLTIDGGNFEYTGTMTANGNLTVTVQNVNFVNGGFVKNASGANGSYTFKNCVFDGTGTYAYPISMKSAKNIVVEDCTVKNYLYGFLYVRGQTTNVSVKNVVVENCPNYAVYFASGVTNATFENLTVKNSNNGFVINNTVNRAFTINNCKMENVVTAINHANATNAITCTVIGNENDFGTAAMSQYAKCVLADVNATLTAPAGLTVTTDVADSVVVYENGVYSVKELPDVAQINDVGYKSIQAAIDAAVDGDTITIVDDHALSSTPVIESTFGYTTLVLIEGKSVTIDFAGHTVTAVTGSADLYAAEIADTLISVIFAGKGASLTLKDSVGNGGIYVKHNADGGKVYSMIYNSASNLVIENGTYTVEETITAGSLIYADKTHTTAVKGGQFTLGNASADASSTKPWIINTHGKNVSFVEVTGGTFNQDILMNYGTEKDCEVQIPRTLALKNNGGDTWTIVDAAAYVGDGEYNNGYATLVEAIAAGNKVTLVADNAEDVELTKSITLDVNGCNYTGTVTLTAENVTLTADEGLNVITNVTDRKVDYVEGVYKLVPKVYVAEVNGEKYESIQEAVEAVEAGATATITVIADHELDWDGETKIDGEYAAMAVDAGKTIILDLNGKKLTADTDKMGGTTLFAVFAADEGGNLTVTGNGTVEVTGAAAAYCLMMAYEPGTKLTIENGTYYLKNASDSLIYSGGDECVIINGGNFTLGNVGTGENGKPWIFNVLGKNAGAVIVNGGTFNADVNHQFWAHEVDVPETLAVKPNGDGTWTVVDAAAYVVEMNHNYTRNVGYATLAEAIAAVKTGETVTLLADNAEDIELTKTITLDLNRMYMTGKITLASADAQLTSAKDLNVVTNIADAEVVYENGTYMVKYFQYVAQIGETMYDDLSDALEIAGESGATVTVIANTSEELVLVPAGVKLDLNGFVVTADNVLSFGIVMDTTREVKVEGSEETEIKIGGIAISNDTTKAFVKLQKENGRYMPMYDSRDGMYKFFGFAYENLGYKTSGTTVKFGVRIKFTNPAGYDVMANLDANNAGIALSSTVRWTGLDESVSYVWSYNSDTINAYANAAGNNPDGFTKAFFVSVGGYDSLSAGDFVSSVFVITSVTGFEYDFGAQEFNIT